MPRPELPFVDLTDHLLWGVCCCLLFFPFQCEHSYFPVSFFLFCHQAQSPVTSIVCMCLLPTLYGWLSSSFRLCSLRGSHFEIQFSLWPNAWLCFVRTPKHLRECMVYFKWTFYFFIIVCVDMCHSAQVWVRKQPSGVCSLFPPHWGSSLVFSVLHTPGQLAHNLLCGPVPTSHLSIGALL